MSRTLLRSSCLLIALTLSACDGGGDADRGDDRDPTPYTARSDVEFIDALLPHHEMALEMAQEIVERGSDPMLVQMAQTMIAAQTAEIDRMQAARRALTGREQPDEVNTDQHGIDDLAALRALDGTQLERRFLEDMIAHHAGAVQLAHRSRANLRHGDMAQLASATVMDQSREIGELHDMLARHASAD
jgi:uncharacterized protein (DUF305 family)